MLHVLIDFTYNVLHNRTNNWLKYDIVQSHAGKDQGQDRGQEPRYQIFSSCHVRVLVACVKCVICTIFVDISFLGLYHVQIIDYLGLVSVFLFRTLGFAFSADDNVIA
ncbi:hypothetical protein ACJX0J_005962 [Zea mays]